MIMHLLPERTSDAAGNMATDFLFLRRYYPADVIRFRHYEWRRPAFTFGYGQQVEFIRRAIASQGDEFDITRRASGGGLVDHREDWTYALVLPRNHSYWDRAGPAIYRTVHEELSASLNECGAKTILQQARPEIAPGICFERPEVDDVVAVDTGAKVAGAAIKRTKEGLLLQGSIWRPAVSTTSWEAFGTRFPSRLSEFLQANLQEVGWPDFDPDEENSLIEQYSAAEWIERR